MPTRLDVGFTVAAIITATSAILETAIADELFVDNTRIMTVDINGGTDTQNPGQSCVTITGSVNGACTSGYVAIPNNNSLLIGAALQAKATSNNIWFFYDDSQGSYVCPGHVYTPCSVISIELK